LRYAAALLFALSAVLAAIPARAQDKADSAVPPTDSETYLSEAEAFILAKKMLERGDFDDARAILENITLDGNTEFEIERKFLLGQIALARSDYDTAIGYFREILADHPDIARVRLDLAAAYMRRGSYYKADYHLRLAASGELPPAVQLNAARMLYEIRANKNWSMYLNFGLSPDNNVGNATEGIQCITFWGLELCNQLPDRESDVGRNVSAGGTFEFGLGERWRLKNDFGVYATKYDNPAYDDIYTYASTGPRYVYGGGDVWLALAGTRRWVAHSPYSWQAGLKTETNYEITKRLSANVGLKYMPTKYDTYSILDGETHGANLSLAYALAPSQYVVFRTGVEKENTDDEAYSNRRASFALGYGVEVPWGFSIYFEPSVQFADYDTESLYVKNGGFEPIRRRDRIYKYTVAVLNRKIDMYGFTPQLSYSYIDRRSNVWQSEFDKNTFEVILTQRF
jgi:tetratricopeptide (TPR) repeat protein